MVVEYLDENYEDYFPKRLGMRYSFKRVKRIKIRNYRYWYHGHDNSHKLRTILVSLLNKNIGKPFKDVYNKFLKYEKYNKTYKPIREIIQDYIGDEIHHVYDDFYIDKDYNIQKFEEIPNKPKLRPILYKWNTKMFPITNELYNTLKLFFGERSCDILYSSFEYESICQIRDLYYKKYFQYHKTELSSLLYDERFNWFVAYKFERIEKTPYREQRRYYAELKKSDRRKCILRKKNQQIENEKYLREYNRLQKEKERMENSLTIERLGFDEQTSFRGEEYHGQKRKKR